MAQLDLESAARLRTKMLIDKNPGLEIDQSVQEEEGWALLTLSEDGVLVGFEFLETEDSWTRPDALLQYFEAANDGFYVAVIVPSQMLEDITELILGMGEEPIIIFTYEDLAIEDKIML